MIQKISNLYYMCLHRLFKFNLISDSIEANKFLENYGSNPFRHRILIHLAKFSYRIYSFHYAPYTLRSLIKPVEAPNDEKTPSSNLCLRSCTVSRQNCSNLKFRELTFEKKFYQINK